MRAKAKIRDERIPYQVPSHGELPDRLDAVLRVIYLVFNEGYYASSGSSLTRPDLSGEAIRLGRLLVELLPEPEAMGLLALMLLHESRRAARTSATGELVLLEDQDRSLWDQEQIAEGTALVERALRSRRFGPYTLQAAIAANSESGTDSRCSSGFVERLKCRYASSVTINLPQWYRQPPRPDRIVAAGPDGARPTITIIVPARNEAANLLPVLTGARPYADELLVIDGHSTDGTRDIAAACGARVILDDGQGKGAAIRRGLEEATGDILVFIDADGSHDPRDIPALVAPILSGSADHVSGSRMLGGSDELHATLHQFVRLVGSQIITLTINYTLGVCLTDCQNGFRAIRREVARRLDLREKITTIEQEMIIKTVRCGYRLVEVATHEYVRANGQSTFRVQDVWPRYLASLMYYLYLWQPPAHAAQPRPVKALA